MEPVQAKLTIRLLADDVVVAESTDAGLWQKVLSSILKGSSQLGSSPEEDEFEVSEDFTGDASVASFAGKVEVHPDELVGALGPVAESPYLHLDSRTWESFKNNFPARGPNAVAAVVFAATALVLWFDELGLDGPTTAQAQAVLGTINVTGKNPGRSIRNCEWLQDRNGRLLLNPARTSQAYRVVKAFCLREGANGSN